MLKEIYIEELDFDFAYNCYLKDGLKVSLPPDSLDSSLSHNGHFYEVDNCQFYSNKQGDRSLLIQCDRQTPRDISCYHTVLLEIPAVPENS